jgi:hypothetical protein
LRSGTYFTATLTDEDVVLEIESVLNELTERLRAEG